MSPNLQHVMQCHLLATIRLQHEKLGAPLISEMSRTVMGGEELRISVPHDGLVQFCQLSVQIDQKDLGRIVLLAVLRKLQKGGTFGVRVGRAENEAECTEKDMERAEKVKAWALNMIPSGVRQDARSNMASVMAGIGMDEKITTEGLMHLTGLSDRGVRKTISALKAFGLLVRVGSDRAGHWEVVGFDP